ncbi:serine hydrolase domain-containing protein [Rathayibacter sp. YIM 133350]|uniref:serine hydrolase domain-containing protein n=1 Tax=Rathayibacter sp. YIM 133350 TaxID=3131992 RepID=UPI00307DCCF3
MSSSRRRMRVAGALAITLALALTACTAPGYARSKLPSSASASLPKETADALKAAVDSAMAQSASSGVVAGVWAPWAGEWTTASGTTTIGGHTPMNTDEHFRIGELTRGMTCTVLLRLVEEKVVRLDEQLIDVLPSVPGTDGITLGQLCQGTSGLADYSTMLAGQFAQNPERIWPPLELASNGLAGGRVAAPGTVWASSDTGYVLLGMALQARTTRSWSDLYNQYVLSPLGLNGTAFPDAATLTVPGSHPAGYLAPRGGDGNVVCDAVRDVSRTSPSSGWTAGGMVSSLDDLHTWAQALATGALVSKTSYKAQWQTVPFSADAPSWQGYGLGAAQYGPLRGASAAAGGYLSAAYSDPGSGLTVAVMLNNATAGKDFARSVALQLASIAAKAASSSGRERPEIALPWSADQMAEAQKAAAVCQPAA